MTTCLISLGGNVGDVSQTFCQAFDRLHQPPSVSVTKRSSLFQTAPVGSASGTAFTNAAAELTTTLTAEELLTRLQMIETELGRVRSVHWGPRTLDLDLIFYGDRVIKESRRLQVPHPACWYRRFVLDPLVEISADFVHPEKGLFLSELRDRLLKRPLAIGVICDDAATLDFVDSLRGDFPDVSFLALQPGADWLEDLALIIWLGPGRLPAWAERFRFDIGWIDASEIPGERRQVLLDLTRSAHG